MPHTTVPSKKWINSSCKEWQSGGLTLMNYPQSRWLFLDAFISVPTLSLSLALGLEQSQVYI